MPDKPSPKELRADESGAFDERVLVSPGYNLITIAAEDKFGRMEEKKIEIVYQP
jgi:hypothetical protein